MKTKQSTRLLCIAGLLVTASVQAMANNAQEQRAEYFGLPPRAQMECTRYKLDQLIGQLQGKSSVETLQKLAEGKRWLETAIGKYDSYLFSNSGVSLQQAG